MTAKPIALDAVVPAPPRGARGHGGGRWVVEPPRPVGEQLGRPPHELHQRHSPRELGGRQRQPVHSPRPRLGDDAGRPWGHLSRVTPPKIRRRP